MKYLKRRTTSPRAFTLVELMVTLMIFSVVATAATSLMVTSANTQRYVLNDSTAISQTELAFRRIVENIRSASNYGCPSPSLLNLVTQPDAAKTVYDIQYSLVGTDLVETDAVRFGTNILVSNVTNFTVTVVQSTKPTAFQVTLTVSAPNSPPVTRQAYVTSRNF